MISADILAVLFRYFWSSIGNLTIIYINAADIESPFNSQCSQLLGHPRISSIQRPVYMGQAGPPQTEVQVFHGKPLQTIFCLYGCRTGLMSRDFVSCLTGSRKQNWPIFAM